MKNSLNYTVNDPVDSPVKMVVKQKPKLGFTGIGWIGKNRLNAIRESQTGEISAVVDPDSAAVDELKSKVTGVKEYQSFEEMLDSEVDGIVIASPSAYHARQALQALKSGKAVFCQKPLGRDELETAEVVEEARSRDLLLGVDFSYRYTEALKQVRETVQSGELGRIFAVQLTFHNAYGPDKPWYYNSQESGGGCVMDLGIHLVDMLFGIMDNPQVSDLKSQLFHKGKRLKTGLEKDVEDYAAVQFVVDEDTVVQLACSWDLPAGREAFIEATVYGEYGGVGFRNLNGSFYDFVAEKYSGTSTSVLAGPPDNWQGRAAVEWSKRLGNGTGFEPEADTYTQIARILDHVYHSQA